MNERVFTMSRMMLLFGAAFVAVGTGMLVNTGVGLIVMGMTLILWGLIEMRRAQDVVVTKEPRMTTPLFDGLEVS